ncbi:MAG: hypothetical protein QM778_33420 [Myxococcales bacterium]
MFKAFMVSVFSLGVCGALSSSAEAQVEPVNAEPAHTNATTHLELDEKNLTISPTRLYGGLWLGFAGHSKYDDTNYRAYGASTVGGQFGIDVVGFYNLISLGAEVRFGAAKSASGDRSNLIDIALKPRLRLVPEDNFPLEFYITSPFGITIPRLSDANSADANIGWNFGVGGGLNLFLHEKFGINVEPMWLTHRFKVDGPSSGKLTIQEFALFINAVLAI